MPVERFVSDTAPGRATPFSQLILKVASRCNMACDYCYMYPSHDTSWQALPRTMSSRTVEAVADRMVEHAERHSLRDVEIVLHGGEPLLAGRDHIARLVERLRRRAPSGLAVRMTVQTNGVLLDDVWLRTLADLDVKVCISIDGDSVHHDRHRKDVRGRGTYSRTARALNSLRQPEFSHLYSGLLAVVDLRNDPVDVYESLLRFAPPRIDFLLPHGNWSRPPPGLPTSGQATPYGDWLSAAFDRWFGADRQETIVRLFRDTVVLILGGPSTSTHLGLSPVGFVVINTDGGYEQVDILRTAGPGEVQTGLDVHAHSLDEVLAHPAVRHRQRGADVLADDCRQCRLLAVCGGGNYAHRYRDGSGFRNRSVFCTDLQRYIDHVRAAVRATGVPS